MARVKLERVSGRGCLAEYDATPARGNAAAGWRVVRDDDNRAWVAWGHDEYGEHPIDAWASSLAAVRAQLELALENPRAHYRLIGRLGLNGPHNPPPHARQGGWQWGAAEGPKAVALPGGFE